MLTRFNHVAIVVPDLDEATKKYKDVLNANVSKQFDYLVDEYASSMPYLLESGWMVIFEY